MRSRSRLFRAPAAFRELLEELFEQAEASAGAAAPDGAQPLPSPLALPALRRLCAELVTLSHAAALPLLPPDDIMRLLEILDVCVASAAAADLGPNAGANAAAGARVLTSLEAAAASLHIMCCKGAPKRALAQERVSALFAAIKTQLTGSVLTWFDPTRRLVHAAATNKAAAAAAAAAALAGDEEEAMEGIEVEPPADDGGARERSGDGAVASDADEEEEETYVLQAGRGRGRGRGRRRTGEANGRWGAKLAASAPPAWVRAVLERLQGGAGGGLLSQAAQLAAFSRLHDVAVVALKDAALAAMEPPPLAPPALHLLHQRGAGALASVFACYPHHRPLLIEELVGAAMRLPTGKHAPRPVLLATSADSAGITTLAAALMLCIQSSVTYPEDGPAASAQEEASERGYTPAAAWATAFWKALMARGGAAAKAAEVDHRAVVDRIQADLLLALLAPEWPAAPVLLLMFARLLCGSGGVQAPDAPARTAAILWLGQLTAKLRVASAVAGEAAGVWSVAALGAPAEEARDEDGEAAAALARAAWAHLASLQGPDEAVGAAAEEEAEEEAAARPGAKRARPGSSPAALSRALREGGEGCEAHTQVVQQCLLAYLASLGRGEPVASSAHRFCISGWASEAAREGGGGGGAADARLRPQWQPSDGMASSSPCPPAALHAAQQLPRGAAAALAAAMLPSKPLARYADALLGKLAAALGDQAPAVRSAALKSVGMVADVDVSALGAPALRDAVVQLLQDGSVSVRAEAVELLGKAAARAPGPLIEMYYEALAKRTCDTGISVRKRCAPLPFAAHTRRWPLYSHPFSLFLHLSAMHILRDAAALPGFTRATAALVRLVHRTSDEEESVQSLAVKMFVDLWFSDPSSSKAPSCSVSMADRATQVGEVALTLYSALRANGGGSLPLGASFPLAALLGRVLLSGDAATRRCCGALAEALRQKVLEAEESDGCGCARSGAAATGSTGTSFVEGDAGALPAALALHAIAVADASLCCPPSDTSSLLATLAPYFIAPTGGVAPSNAASDALLTLQCLLSVGESIMGWHAARGLRMPRQLVDRLSTSLSTLVSKGTQLGMLGAGVRALCALAKADVAPTAGASSVATRALEAVVSLARRHRSLMTDAKLACVCEREGGPDVQLAKRCLFILGQFVRHGAGLLDLAADTEEAVGGKESSPLRPAALLKLFSRHMRAQDGTLQVVALRACGAVLVARPSMLLPEAARAAGSGGGSNKMASVHEAALAPSASESVKDAALQNLTDLFRQQELELEQAQAGRQAAEASAQAAAGGASAKKRKSAPSSASAPHAADAASAQALSLTAGGGDSSVCGALAQHYWDRILALVPDCSPRVRASALGLVEVLLKGGLVMPMHAVPVLIAACCDSVERSQKLAQRLLLTVADKDAMFLTTRVAEGLEAALCFRQGLARAGRLAGGEELASPDAARQLADIYWRFRATKNLRPCLTSALARLLEEGGGAAAGGAPTPAQRLVRQRFAARVLSALSFCGADEPAALVASLNRAISNRGATLVSSLKAHLASAPGDSKPLPPALAEEAASGLAVALLLLLKGYLRGTYGLSEAVMARHVAGEGPAPATAVDKLVAPFSRAPGAPEVLCLGAVPRVAPATYGELAEAQALLKRLMRDDANDFAGTEYAPSGGRNKAARRSLAPQQTPLGWQQGDPVAHTPREEALPGEPGLAAAAASTGRGRGGRGGRGGAGRGRRGRGRVAGKPRGAAAKARARDSSDSSEGGEEPQLGGDDDEMEDSGEEHLATPKKRLKLA